MTGEEMLEQVTKATEKIQGLVESLSSDRGKMIQKMLLDSPVSELYFSAPASSREHYHSSYPGGLAVHSWNVLTTLTSLCKTLAPNRYPTESIIIAALFHDLGKCGDGKEPYYMETNEDWKRKRGEFYDINNNCIKMTVPDRSLYILQLYGINLTSDEYLAIRISDGQYVDENKWYSLKEPDLALLTHFADVWCTKQEKH